MHQPCAAIINRRLWGLFRSDTEKLYAISLQPITRTSCMQFPKSILECKVYWERFTYASLLKTISCTALVSVRDPNQCQCRPLVWEWDRYALPLTLGQEKGDRLEDRVQLACVLKVKELNGLGVWSKRFCILCGSRMFIFATSRPKGKPTLVLDLTGGSIMEHQSKKHFYCLKITASRKDVLLSFESRLEQSKWLQRAAKVGVYNVL